MFNNNTPVYGFGYGAPRPQARNTQPLTEEQIAKLQQNGDPFSMKVDQEDLWRAACTHKRRDNGMSTLIQNQDGTYTCTICHETFNLCDSSKEDIDNAVKTIIDMLQTIKTVYLDAPEELIVQYMKQIPLLKKMPQLWDRAMRNFSMYEGAMNPLNQINNPGMSSFAAVQNLLANPYGFGQPMMQQPAYGYGYNMMGAQQPMMQQPNYNMMGAQQPMMQQQPAYGYGYPVPQNGAIDPNAMNNPMAYGSPVAPMPGVMPAAAPAAPAATPAPANNGQVETTTVMTI